MMYHETTTKKKSRRTKGTTLERIFFTASTYLLSGIEKFLHRQATDAAARYRLLYTSKMLTAIRFIVK